MPHGWKLCLQAFHLSFLTCGCYGFLSLLGLALEEGQLSTQPKPEAPAPSAQAFWLYPQLYQTTCLA